MSTVKILHKRQLPDPVRISRFRAFPKAGPEILFLSGGSAIRGLSKKLTDYTYNSIHIVTPFDSGGSSAKLRHSFGMPAVGDLRNRLMALADDSIFGQPEIIDLFAFRFDSDITKVKARTRLKEMIAGHDPLVAVIPDPMRKLIRNHLGYFWEKMPKSFDLREANIGNLIITGGYLNNSRQIDPVLYLFSKLVEVRGIVRPVSGRSMHLITELENGENLIGQHLLCGKEGPPISSPVKRVYLSEKKRNPIEAELMIKDKVRALIESAGIICYPMGSFYSSLIANILPVGVGSAIVANPVPKIYIPNTFTDPEQLGMTLEDSVKVLLRYLQKSCEKRARISDLLNYVIIDKKTGITTPGEIKAIKKLGVEVVDVRLAEEDNSSLLDPTRLAEVLLSFE